MRSNARRWKGILFFPIKINKFFFFFFENAWKFILSQKKCLNHILIYFRCVDCIMHWSSKKTIRSQFIWFLTEWKPCRRTRTEFPLIFLSITRFTIINRHVFCTFSSLFFCMYLFYDHFYSQYLSTITQMIITYTLCRSLFLSFCLLRFCDDNCSYNFTLSLSFFLSFFIRKLSN